MNVNYPNGFVVLPVGEYNKMKEVIEAQQQVLDNIVQDIKPGMATGKLEVVLNTDTIHSLAVCKFEENPELVNNYTLFDKSIFSVWAYGFAELKPEDVEVEGE